MRLASNSMPIAAHNQVRPALHGGISQGSGGRIDREVHAVGNFILHRESDRIGTVRLEDGEVPAAVQDRRSGGDDDVGRCYLAERGLDGGSFALCAARLHPGDPNAFNELSGVFPQVGSERGEHFHGVDLRLTGHAQGARHCEGQFRRILQDGGESGIGARIAFLAEEAGAVVGYCIVDGVPDVIADAVLVAEPEQPALALAVTADVVAGQGRTVVFDYRGQLRALQQGHLCGAVSGGYRANRASLQDGNPLARSRKQRGGCQSGDAGADHHGIVLSTLLEGIGGNAR